MNFLHTLIDQHRTEKSLVQPRLRSRFEPQVSTMGDHFSKTTGLSESHGEIPAQPNMESKHVPPSTQSTISSANSPVPPPWRTPAQIDSGRQKQERKPRLTQEKGTDFQAFSWKESANSFLQEEKTGAFQPPNIPPLDQSAHSDRPGEDASELPLVPKKEEEFPFSQKEGKEQPLAMNEQEKKIQQERSQLFPHSRGQVPDVQLPTADQPSGKRLEPIFPQLSEEKSLPSAEPSLQSPKHESASLPAWIAEFKEKADALLAKPTPPSIKVHIGRVEVRANVPAVKSSPRKPPGAQPRLTVEGYLHKQNRHQR